MMATYIPFRLHRRYRYHRRRLPRLPRHHRPRRQLRPPSRIHHLAKWIIMTTMRRRFRWVYAPRNLRSFLSDNAMFTNIIKVTAKAKCHVLYNCIGLGQIVLFDTPLFINDLPILEADVTRPFMQLAIILESHNLRLCENYA